MRFRTGYMDDGLFNLNDVITRAQIDLEGEEFDTFIGTGFSGGVVIPSLAMAMGKNYLLVRKESDNSHHGGTVMGDLGERFIFVDDFTGTGRTKSNVMAAIKELEPEWPDYAPIRTTYLGDYYYARNLRWRPLVEPVEMVMGEPVLSPSTAIDEVEVAENLPRMELSGGIDTGFQAVFTEVMYDGSYTQPIQCGCGVCKKYGVKG